MKELLSSSHDRRLEMAQAVNKLMEIVKSAGNSNGEIEFKKYVWEEKNYHKMKQESKKNKEVLKMFKTDRDKVIAN